ncbi:hypothetical protein [Cognatilysobacter lacus]|uniref:Uncharacterized protein n=1 Tax=Cognatilysobacter lacus TaxID=1643323 RepID=A0A5D8YZU7_9GAMM|nr:hypothetical protein [Lysobacter lacus]TZF87363.1 hypothetical protein FW784_11255 [Lysobacter lacus]
MTILEGLLRGEAAGSRAQTWTAEGVLLDVGGIQRTLKVARSDEAFEVDRYTVWVVRTLDNAEAAVRAVVIKAAERKTIGYIFPTSSFRTTSDFCATALDDKFQRLYATVAAHFLVDVGVANEVVSGEFFDLPEVSELCDCLPSGCSVVVVARRIVESQGATTDVVRLALQEHGYYPLPPKVSFSHAPFAVTAEGVRNIALPAASIGPWIELISNLVAVAAAQPTPVGAFIGYYQVVELLSNERFKSEVSRITSDPALSDDPWALKEKLIEASGEKRRVRALVACCQAEVSGALNDLERYGKAVLRSVGQAELEKLSAGDVLYKVRSVLVHDQKSLPQSALTDLCEMIKALHLVIFGLVRVFDPAFQSAVSAGD